MAIDVYWGSGSPYSWRVLLALEHKGLEYRSHLLQIALQEQKSPHMLALNPRGRVPTLKDGDYVVFESLAVLYYLDRKYPAKPLLGALALPEARELSSRFLPLEANYPALGRWMQRVESLPGYERTYPPHWREAPS